MYILRKKIVGISQNILLHVYKLVILIILLNNSEVNESIRDKTDLLPQYNLFPPDLRESARNRRSPYSPFRAFWRAIDENHEWIFARQLKRGLKSTAKRTRETGTPRRRREEKVRRIVARFDSRRTEIEAGEPSISVYVLVG